MRGIWRNQQGTASVGEYLLTFVLVVAVVAGMASYFQRSLQGRMRDARHHMVENIRQECIGTDCAGKGFIGEGYEPYYSQVNAIVARNEVMYKGLAGSSVGTTGVFSFRSSAKNESESSSQQLPPMNAINDRILGSR